MTRRAVVGRFEIPAVDVERAARFYRDAFGWRIEPVEWPGEAYFEIRIDGGPIGGGLTTPEVLGADRPLVVIHVEGAPLAEWLARIVAAGGSVAAPAEPVGELGAFARSRDSEGNLFGLWQGRGAGHDTT